MKNFYLMDLLIQEQLIKKLMDVLNYLKKFGWKEIKEGKNIIGLSQIMEKIFLLNLVIKLSLLATKLKNIHEVCSRSLS